MSSFKKDENCFEDTDLQIMKYMGNLSDDEIKKIKCFMSLPVEGIEKLERINSSIANRTSAEAEFSKHAKWKVLFERAARETLPFIVYVIYIAGLNKLNIFNVLAYDDKKLCIGTVLVIMMMTFPLIFFFLCIQFYHERDKQSEKETDN